ncbi:BRO family protein (plasmid) [Latilactobacillus curvatus]|uniref:BRO family protein n=2 Tax=Latilactobacillus TaxID=2767885 RepID=UPI0024B93F3C|nr:BRO family protein [Latilactobacillus curvatus]WHQ77650.1 BRO family protein [Latilactobacillus curvatus]WHQ79254.1 BRO family protein [Latilactobacillus curvatus]WHQ79305.1 BRO family protein [Latilactobacillus curvatus]
MNDLQLFNFNGDQVRTVLIGGEPHFVGKDVADILGYSETNAMTKRLDEEDFISTKLSGMNMKSTIINESGLYAAIIGSKLPKAKKFKRWVTGEVLPTIRKNGAYLTDQKAYDVTHNKDALADLLVQAGNQLKEKELQITEMKPKADYFDDLVDRNLLTNFRDTAKELHVKQKTFVDWLLKKKYVYRDKRGQLKHYAKYDDDLFEFREFASEWTDKAHLQSLITPKGRVTFKLQLEQSQPA